MSIEVKSIIKRLMEATGSTSERGLCSFLGLSSNATGNWKTQDSIPYKACFIAAQKTGFSTDWILTGEGEKKLNNCSESFALDQEKLFDEFAETLADGVDFGFIAVTEDTTNENFDVLARILYKRLTGERATFQRDKKAG